MRAGTQALLDALLYEGYALYPYRANALKNRRRESLHALAAPGDEGRTALRCDCLVSADAEAVRVLVRFLRDVQRRVEAADAPGVPLRVLQVDGVPHHPWNEGEACQLELGPVALDRLGDGEASLPFRVGPAQDVEDLVDRAGRVVGRFVRTRGETSGVLRVAAGPAEGAPSFRRLRVTLENTTDDPSRPPEARRLEAAHVVLSGEAATFASVQDPPPGLEAAAEACQSRGAWPVMLGPPGAQDAVLLTPVILLDHPRVAPESPGDFFDATEIDEMLALRVRTLLPAELAEARATDPRARAAVDRALALGPEGLAPLHGAIRPPPAPGPGTRVRLRPRRRADALDRDLDGRLARVLGTETDLDGNTYVTVALDDDPGAHLAEAGVPGHRFFFYPEEVEPLARAEAPDEGEVG